ncbi:MAG: GNAT family N-acetyltransferase [Thermoplasmata archaeon]
MPRPYLALGASMIDLRALSLVDLEGEERERAVPLLIEGFVGIYRWHAKRTLRRIGRVRGALREGQLVGVSMLERLAPEVGYVYYLAVGTSHRRLGIGGLLLDDALALFLREGARIAYGAAEEDNTSSLDLFRSRGFREVERRELGYQEGGLGAWGLRSKMMLVSGEVLMGRRLGGNGETTVVRQSPVAASPSKE